MKNEQPEAVNNGEQQGKDRLYAVLNLHRAASQNEINERHRALSLIFHPDKQQDPRAKEIATRTFLEIQKAYQVLSDTFLREVYDTLGEQGLAYKWDESVRRKSKEELKEIFLGVERKTREKKLRDQIQPRGRLECSIDASSLFAPYQGSAKDTLPVRLAHRMEGIRMVTCNLRHSVQRRLDSKTVVAFTTRVSRDDKQGAALLFGAVRHQFSPRLSSEVVATLLAPHVFKWVTDYEDENNTLSMKTSFAPFMFGKSPSATLTFSRRLFPRRHARGVLNLHVARLPQLAFNVVLPSHFGSRTSSTTDENAPPGSAPPSISGLAYGIYHRSIGIVFNSFLPKFVGEAGVTLTELSLQLKIGFELGLDGLSWAFTGSWSNESAEIMAATIWSPMAVVLKLDFAYLEQRFSLPIVLSQQHSPITALCTVVLPSTAMVIGYHFILKPRRRAARFEYIRAARRAHEEDLGAQRERDAVVALLRDAAKRHTHNETAKGGLIILEATYSPIEKEDRVNELTQDVTVPVQALVRNSQLHIPGDQSKSGLQGFVDPAPFTSKVLRIRYLFSGREHYAEIADSAPVVLPLAEHLVV
ncbi:hypothetical protein APHAL10511_006945 [Amanita phalloides]|nr:hypothetical protein APHAL10511_006945 [Amanita phalloides]